MAKKKAENEIIEEVKVTKPKIATKKKLKLSNDININVRSNRYGRLVYVNSKTNEVTRWDNFDDVQVLTVGDLNAMKATQPTFFSEQWITFDGIAEIDEEYEEVDVLEIYEAIGVSKYYSKYLCVDDINEVFNWSPERIRTDLPKMAKGVQESLIIRANELIEKEILDSNKKIKAIEETLKIELRKNE